MTVFYRDVECGTVFQLRENGAILMKLNVEDPISPSIAELYEKHEEYHDGGGIAVVVVKGSMSSTGAGCLSWMYGDCLILSMSLELYDADDKFVDEVECFKEVS